MTHLAIDADPLVYKAAGVTEKVVYDIVANSCPMENVDVDDPQTYAPYKIATFRYVKEYKEWLAQHKKTKDDFIRIDRKEIAPLSHALNIVNLMIQDMINAIQPEQVTVLLTAEGGNFREQIAQIRPYKESRKDKQKPIYYKEIREFMVNKWHAHIVEGCEADDVCAMILAASVDEGHPTVLASIDKDLDSVAGLHYNYDRKEYYQVSHEEALRFFYAQVLAGDDTDSIPGIKGIAMKTAMKKLGRASTEHSLWRKVLAEYAKALEYTVIEGRTYTDVAIEMARLVYMQRNWGELWQPPA